MARIRSKDTSPETVLRRALWHRGKRYRIHFKTASGTVDLAFPRARLAVFVDGCFWHGCPEHYTPPKTRGSFWAKKLETNVTRDARQTKSLLDEGWNVLRFWEHQINNELEEVLLVIGKTLVQGPLPTPDDWRVIHVQPIEGRPGTDRKELINIRNPSRRRIVERSRSPAAVSK